MLDALDFKWAQQALALDTFEDINFKIGSKSLKHWNVNLDHRDGSTLHFIGAVLVEYDGWLGCFTQRHGFYLYHTSDLKRYNCSVASKRGPPLKTTTSTFIPRLQLDKEGPVVDG